MPDSTYDRIRELLARRGDQFDAEGDEWLYRPNVTRERFEEAP